MICLIRLWCDCSLWKNVACCNYTRQVPEGSVGHFLFLAISIDLCGRTGLEEVGGERFLIQIGWPAVTLLPRKLELKQIFHFVSFSSKLFELF